MGIQVLVGVDRRPDRADNPIEHKRLHLSLAPLSKEGDRVTVDGVPFGGLQMDEEARDKDRGEPNGCHASVCGLDPRVETSPPRTVRSTVRGSLLIGAGCRSLGEEKGGIQGRYGQTQTSGNIRDEEGVRGSYREECEGDVQGVEHHHAPAIP